jgi:AcrR family transcriptional regulator
MSRFKQFFSCHAASPLLADGGAGRGRLRAIDGDEKEARRQAILDAADRLFAERQELANVADVATAAGLAKGTVYLYFQSKEEIYLALHLRHVEHFFTRLIARLDGTQPFSFGEMQSLADQHILSATTYLPLGACCIGFAAGAVRVEAAAHFQGRLLERLQAAGVGLERHFSGLARGEGVRLLKHSYAIMVGLYSLMRSEPSGDPRCPRIEGIGSFQDEAALALMRYWSHVAGIADHSVSPSRHSDK